MSIVRYEPWTTILVAPTKPLLDKYRDILAKRGIHLSPSQCFTLRQHGGLLGRKVAKVLVALPEQVQHPGVHSKCVEALITGLASNPEREGFYSVDENGDLSGPRQAV